MGLLVEKLRLVAKYYALALRHHALREFGVLSQAGVVPAALQKMRTEHIPRAGNVSCDAEQMAGTVQSCRTAVEMYAVCRGDEVGIKIFGVAVGGEHARARRKGVVHLLEPIGRKHIVGIKESETVEICNVVVCADIIEQPL